MSSKKGNGKSKKSAIKKKLRRMKKIARYAGTEIAVEVERHSEHPVITQEK